MMSSLRKIRGWVWGFGLGAMLLVLSGACSSPAPPCSGELADTATDPNGKECTKVCDCNNLLFSGTCDSGTCTSKAREDCTTAGEKRSCTLAASTSCKLGLQTCQPEELKGNKKWGDCKPITVTAEKGVALCADGLDNDCDGKTDKDDEDCKDICVPGRQRSCYDGAAGTAGKGICKEGRQICGENGAWGSCEGQVKPATEDCNGLDDDCNGTVDDGAKSCECRTAGQKEPCYTGAAGTQNKGVCRAGVRTCGTDGKWGACEGQVTPGKETCNGVDDDCNGMVDDGLQDCQCTKPGEQQPCYSGDPKTLNVGICSAGIKTCTQSGAWGACVGEIVPKAETCNQQDDNCDGSVDEGVANCETCSAGEQRPCYSGAAGTAGKGECVEGKQTCRSDRTWGACVGQVAPQPEVCNGKDDDCDGNIDEDFPTCNFCKRGATRPCFTGNALNANVGECKQGVQTCVTDDNWGICENEVLPVAEECNNKDDDCDGTVDEGLSRSCYTGATGCAGSPGDKYQCTGSCLAGQQTCSAGQWGSCVGSVIPQKEVCNKLDDDCDGQTDEDNTCGVVVCQPNQTRLCYEGPAQTRGFGLCKEGTETCSNNAWGACTGAVYPVAETCDGKDENCNGMIDDGCFTHAFSYGSASVDVASDVAADAQGNFYVTGSFSGSITLGSNTYTSKGSSDVFIAKIDASGMVLWSVVLGGPGAVNSSSITINSSGNAYVIGRFEQSIEAQIGTTTTTLTSKGKNDVFAVKINPQGKFFWAVSFGGTGEEYGAGISLDTSDNVYITGSFEDKVNFITTKTETSKGGSDIYVVKLDPSGKALWATTAGGTEDDYAAAIASDQGGRTYITGAFRGNASFGATGLLSKGKDDAFAAKLDRNGNFLWTVAVSGTEIAAGGGIAYDFGVGVYVTGTFKGTVTLGGNSLTAKGDSDIFVVKLNDLGGFEWVTPIGGVQPDNTGYLTIGGNGDIYLVGTFEGKLSLGNLNFQSKGSSDVFVTRIDKQGKVLWASTAGGTGIDIGYGIAVDGKGYTFACGFFSGSSTFGSKSLTSKGSLDFFVTRLNP